MEPQPKPASTELVLSTAFDSAIASLSDKYPQFQGVDQAVLAAEAILAADTELAKRTQRQRILLHFQRSIDSVMSASNRGLIKTPEEAGRLVDEIIYTGVNPSKAIAYLTPSSTRHLTRALTPTELTNALCARESFEGDATISEIATVADNLGIMLHYPLQRAELTMIADSMQTYNGQVEYTAIDDDPLDGPVSVRRRRRVRGIDINNPNRAYGLAPSYPGEFEGSFDEDYEYDEWN